VAMALYVILMVIIRSLMYRALWEAHTQLGLTIMEQW
jgi:hypothetical protein